GWPAYLLDQAAAATDGGTSATLARFAEQPLNTVSFGAVVRALATPEIPYGLPGIDLEDVDLSATPLGSLPVGSLALGVATLTE
ncbi:hypothetical protein, partial [Enterococcus casseliflavus]|uniref:hypothetical protein n=1 Tax=Enterococcus casseliflavus TaxID=37734 RepID=UPI003D0C064C